MLTNRIQQQAMLSGVLDDIMGAGKTLSGVVDEKAAKLEGALKIILVLSGIAAFTGIVNVVSRRRA